MCNAGLVTSTIPEVVGHNLRQRRVDHTLTLDQIARGLRMYSGELWSSGRVSRFEHGDGPVTVDTLILLAVTLTDLTGNGVTPADLLEADGTVTIGRASEATTESDAGGITVEGALVKQYLLGQKVGLHHPFQMELVELPLADKRAATKLGIDEQRFREISRELWGHLMSEEVEAQAPPGATAQKKGRITRNLRADMQKALDHGND